MKPYLLCLLLALTACQPPTVPTQYPQGFSRFQVANRAAGVGTLSRTRDGGIYIQGVPFVKQGQDNTCGQAVSTMMLQYWGHDIDYQTVVNESNPLNLGTTYNSLETYLRQKGLHAQSYREGSLELLQMLLDRGRPVIVLLDFGGITKEHYVVVTGYNPNTQTLIFHESNSGPYRELPVPSFLAMWANTSLVNAPLIGGKSYYRLMFDVGPTPADAEG